MYLQACFFNSFLYIKEFFFFVKSFFNINNPQKENQ